MYNGDGSSDGQARGSYEIFKAEGDVLFKQGEFKKALESFNTALEMKPAEKNCLIARSKCYLQLGEPENALADANETLKDDKKYIKGLLQKAEAYYQQGKFEFALMFYHRGHKIRPEVQAFRLGMQKAQEAIDNSVGDSAAVKLKCEGDMSFFYAEQLKGKPKKQVGYSKPVTKKEEKKEDNRRAKTSSQDCKTMKQLLGELYKDKEYLETLLHDTENTPNKSESNAEIVELTSEVLNYLDKRMEFWQQQKPAQKSAAKKAGGERRALRGGKDDPKQWVLRSLEEIDEALAEHRYEESLKQAKKVLKTVQDWSDEEIPNRSEVVANLHSCIGNAHLELGNNSKALEHYESDHEIAKQRNLSGAKSRALDNLGRVYARMKKFEKAIAVWEEKLPLSSSALEKTWLYHEIGRCYLELGQYDVSMSYGEKSLAAADDAADDVWQLNASILMAQSQVKLGDLQSALDQFEKSLEMARTQKDGAAESAIRKAIEEVNGRIVSGVKTEKDSGDNTGDEQGGEDGGEEGGEEGEPSDEQKVNDTAEENGTTTDEKETTES